MKIGTDGVLLGAWTEVKGANRILDVGTGSGIIALIMAQRSGAEVDAVEIDPGSARQADENFRLSFWPNRLHLVESSFQDFSSSTSSLYDLIVSNPPYFSRSLKSPNHLRTRSRHDDLLPASHLFEGAYHILSPQGKISVIIPCLSEKSWIKSATESNYSISRKMIVYPKLNKQANRCLLEFSRSSSQVEESDLTILDSDGSYTKEYKELTKDFYLAF